MGTAEDGVAILIRWPGKASQRRWLLSQELKEVKELYSFSVGA